jgi:hypothetical protein
MIKIYNKLILLLESDLSVSDCINKIRLNAYIDYFVIRCLDDIYVQFYIIHKIKLNEMLVGFPILNNLLGIIKYYRIPPAKLLNIQAFNERDLDNIEPGTVVIEGLKVEGIVILETLVRNLNSPNFYRSQAAGIFKYFPSPKLRRNYSNRNLENILNSIFNINIAAHCPRAVQEKEQFQIDITILSLPNHSPLNINSQLGEVELLQKLEFEILLSSSDAEILGDPIQCIELDYHKCVDIKLTFNLIAHPIDRLNEPAFIDIFVFQNYNYRFCYKQYVIVFKTDTTIALTNQVSQRLITDSKPLNTSIMPIVKMSSPDATIIIERMRETNISLEYNWLLLSRHPKNKLLQVIKRISKDMVLKCKNEFTKIEDQNGYEAAVLFIRSYAPMIRDQIPESIRNKLDKIMLSVREDGPDIVPSLLIISNEFILPWELAAMDSQKGGPDTLLGISLIGIEWAMGRWVVCEEDTRAAECETLNPYMIAVLHGDTIKEDSAYKIEAEYLHKYNPVDVPANEVFNFLTNNDERYGMLHFLMHGLHTQRFQTEQHFIELDTKTRLEIHHITGALMNRKRKPFIFYNVCYAGFSGISGDCSMSGFIAGSIRGGCSGVIGPWWKLSSPIATKVAIEFYSQALGNEYVSQDKTVALGEIMRRIRLNFINSSKDNKTIDYLAYVYYGHPHLRISNEMKGD